MDKDYDEDEVNEYNITIKVRVATYETGPEVMAFSRRLAAMLAADIEPEKDFLFKTNPIVELKWHRAYTEKNK